MPHVILEAFIARWSASATAERADVESILESLSRLGIARSYRDGQANGWSAVRIA